MRIRPTAGGRHGDHALVATLLGFAAGMEPPHGALRPRKRLQAEFRWIVVGGLGPLLLRLSSRAGWQLPDEWQHRLLAADLAGRLHHPALVASALDVAHAAYEAGVHPILLKGIATSEDLYPAAHLRPMSDVDVLLPASVLPKVESLLVERGYVQSEHGAPHHGPPLYHAGTKAWVELHSMLFPPSTGLCSGSTFDTGRLDRESPASTFHGLPVRRLADEVQLAYMCSTLMNDLIHAAPAPAFLSTLVDAIRLLHLRGAVLSWQRLCAMLDNPMARASTFVTLGYLTRRGYASVPRGVLDELRADQDIVGLIQAACIHAVLDRYLIGARAWTLPFPPPVPGRYGLRFQWRKRVVPRIARLTRANSGFDR